MMPRPLLSVLLLVVLAGALVYYWGPDGDLAFEKSAQHRALPKTYLVNTRTITYDEKGSLTEILEASDVRYFPNKKRSFITEPRYYAHNGNNRTWSVTSDRARFLDKVEILFLEGNVVLTDDQNGGHLMTEAMQISLRKKIATSDKPVTFTQGLNITTANGMVADMNKEQLRLMPDVESIYAPAKP